MSRAACCAGQSSERSALFGSHTPFTVLLRPDNYIAAIWPGLDISPAQQWLASHIATQPAP